MTLKSLVFLVCRVIARGERIERRTHTRARRRSKIIWNTRMRTYWNLEHAQQIWNTHILGMRSVIARSTNKSWRCPKRDPHEWKRRRLEAFARREYAFSTGQKPRKGSRWHRDLCAIEACPTYGKPVSARDPYGRPLVCKGGYHKTSAKVSNICRFIFVNVLYVL